MVRVSVLLFSAAVLGGCVCLAPASHNNQPENAGPVPAASSGAAYFGGNLFVDHQLDSNVWRVRFLGYTGGTPEEEDRVQDQLLYHCAQLTLDRGFDWFVMAEPEEQTLVHMFGGPKPVEVVEGWEARRVMEFVGPRIGAPTAYAPPANPGPVP
jgi:hypothetical protein